MSLKQRSIQWLLPGAILLCLFVALYILVAKQPEKENPANDVIKHPVDTDPDETLKYWTKKRMRRAKPAPMPNIDEIELEKQNPPNPPHKTQPKQS